MNAAEVSKNGKKQSSRSATLQNPGSIPFTGTESDSGNENLQKAITDHAARAAEFWQVTRSADSDLAKIGELKPEDMPAVVRKRMGK